MPLTAAQCPLLPPDSPLLGLFNRLEKAVNEVRAVIGSRLEASDLQPVNRGLQDAADRLRRQRYRVGFLGRSAVGKSTSLNLVVQCKLASEGSGLPATSTISRFTPEKPGTPPACTLWYMSAVQFQQRRCAIARKVLNIPSCPDDVSKDKTFGDLKAENAAILSELERQVQDTERARKGEDDGTKMDSRGSDRDALGRLLRAYNTHGEQYVRATPHAEPVTLTDSDDYSAQLHAYTNHQPAADGHPNDLLFQVEVRFPTANASTLIELIDLPGLGTQRESDDITTLAMLDQLDGALLLLRAGQLGDGTATGILNMLHGSESDPRWPYAADREPLRGRVWVVGTFADSLGRTNYGLEGNNADTVLDHLTKMFGEFAIPPTNIVMVANLFHKEVLERRAASQETTLADRRATFKIKFTDAGRAIIPPKLLADPAAEPPHFRTPALATLWQAFEDLFEDGGIERLRGVVVNTVGEQIRRRIGEYVCGQLGRTAKGMKRVGEAVLQAGRFDPKDYDAAVQWALRAKRLSGRPVGDEPLTDSFRQLGRDAATRFAGVLQELRVMFEAQACEPLGDLRDQHAGLATNLQSVGTAACRKAAREHYDWAHQQLEEAGRSLRAVALDGQYSTPALALRAALDAEVLALDACLTPFATLDSAVFFPREDDAIALPFADYQDIMRAKISETVREVCHRVLARSSARLVEVRDKLTLLTKQQGGAKATTINEDDLKRLIAELQQLADEADALALAYRSPTA